MDKEKLLARLEQIEEHARLTLAEWPAPPTPERQRMIIALARSLRLEIKTSEIADPAVGDVDPDRTVEEGPH